MLLNQEMLRLVFGIKLHTLRVDKNLSLKDLAKRTGLSPSYLNEIENGKKYPKTEKILILAEALEEKYEDLISLELKKDLQVLQNLIEKNILSAIPFDVFGIPVSTIFQLLVEKPKKIRALIGTLLELSRAHHIVIDDVFHALLRSYLDMHQNYFPSIESAAKTYRTQKNLDWRFKNAALKAQLIESLQVDYKIDVIEKNLTEISQDLNDVLYFLADHGSKVYISNKLDLREQIFILAREVGYCALKLKLRPLTSLVVNLDSFEQLFNHFSAGYFASSLLIPEDEIIADGKLLFQSKTWTNKNFESILQKYACPYESVFHRLTQVLPRHFNLKNLFYLRYEFDVVKSKYEIARELHLANFQGPHRIRSPENYCSRWLIEKLTQAQLRSDKPFQMGVQRSQYHGTENEYLIIGVAFKKPLSKNEVSSVCLGILVNQKLAEKANWLDSSTIPKVVVGETCERCAVENCESRKHKLELIMDPTRLDRIHKLVHSFDS
jgi:transcriptional regulator with XRE-family HTH domain